MINNSNKQTPAISIELADSGHEIAPEKAADVADIAIDMTISPEDGKAVDLAVEAKSSLSGIDFSYDKYGVRSPSEIMESFNGQARAARAFIDSRRANKQTPAAVRLADELYLRGSSRKSKNMAASDDYLKKLIEDCNSEALDTAEVEADAGSTVGPVVVTESILGTEKTPATVVDKVAADTVEPRANSENIEPNRVESVVGAKIVKPAMEISPVPVDAINAETEPSEPKLPEPKIDPETGEYSSNVFKKPVEALAELKDVNKEIALIDDDFRHRPHDHEGNIVTDPMDPITTERVGRRATLLEAAKKLAKIYKNEINKYDSPTTFALAVKKAAKDKFDQSQKAKLEARSNKIKELLTAKPSARTQKRLANEMMINDIKKGKKDLEKRIEDSGLSDEYKSFADALSKHGRKIGPEKISKLRDATYALEKRWRNHPVQSKLDAREQRDELDSILFAQDGMLLKMFTAKGINYDDIDPKQLHEIVSYADTKNTIRSSRGASMGRFATALSEVGGLVAGSAAAGLSFIPWPPVADLYYGREELVRGHAIAHLDRAAAARYNNDAGSQQSAA